MGVFCSLLRFKDSSFVPRYYLFLLSFIEARLLLHYKLH